MNKKVLSLAIGLLLVVASIPLFINVGAAEETCSDSEVCAYYFHRPGCGNCNFPNRSRRTRRPH